MQKQARKFGKQHQNYIALCDALKERCENDQPIPVIATAREFKVGNLFLQAALDCNLISEKRISSNGVWIYTWNAGPLPATINQSFDLMQRAHELNRQRNEKKAAPKKVVEQLTVELDVEAKGDGMEALADMIADRVVERLKPLLK